MSECSVQLQIIIIIVMDVHLALYQESPGRLQYKLNTQVHAHYTHTHTKEKVDRWGDSIGRALDLDPKDDGLNPVGSTRKICDFF